MKISEEMPTVFRERNARTLKVSRSEYPSSFLLQLDESRGRVRIFRQRSSELTGYYRYRAVSLGWIEQFLQANLATKPESNQSNSNQPIPNSPTEARKTTERCYHYFGTSVVNGRTCSICRGRGHL